VIPVKSAIISQYQLC